VPALPRGPRRAALCVTVVLATIAVAGEKASPFWDVDDIREGMTGVGRTVLKGTKLEEFRVEVLGVLRNTSPGRDMVLARLSGLDLEKTGVIAGMSGSPVYIDGKLLGAVAYAWPFGKEPIAGITPITQMIAYGDAHDRKPCCELRRVGLRRPLAIDGKQFDAVTVAGEIDNHAASDGLWLMPLRTPLAATGFTPYSLALLGDALKHTGAIPVTGGGTTGRVAAAARDAKIEPGGPLSVALVTGDFDLSGIGTVTHVDDDRVYGWGHPLMGLGECEFPLMTGYIHTVYPRQTVSFKLGSPLRMLGTIHADVSTCIAGRLGKTPDLLPVSMKVSCQGGEEAKTFNVEVVRQRSLVAQLVFAALTNSVDMEGELPEELTAELRAVIDVEGQGAVVIEDTLSGGSVSGGRAPSALYNPVAAVVHMLANNSFRPVRVNRIECATRLKPGRCTAEVDTIELEADTYAPGETLKGTVFLKPYRGPRQRIAVELPLPSDLPEGTYTATVCDGQMHARQTLRERPHLQNPQTLEQVIENMRVQTSGRRTQLVVRVPTGPRGVALHDGRTLPDLPPGVAQVLSGTRRSGAQPVGSALVTRHASEWVVIGSEQVKFTVRKNRIGPGGN
jgi:hypothetical protein